MDLKQLSIKCKIFTILRDTISPITAMREENTRHLYFRKICFISVLDLRISNISLNVFLGCRNVSVLMLSKLSSFSFSMSTLAVVSSIWWSKLSQKLLGTLLDCSIIFCWMLENNYWYIKLININKVIIMIIRVKLKKNHIKFQKNVILKNCFQLKLRGLKWFYFFWC